MTHDGPLIERVDPAGLTVRYPDPARHPVEGPVAEANHRAQSDSVGLLDRLVPGLAFADLGQRADGGTLTVARTTDDLLTRLDGAALLERLLVDQDLDMPRLKLARHGDIPDIAAVVERIRADLPTSRAPAALLASALGSGSTFVLDGIDLKDATLARLSEHVERAYRTMININGYVSLRPHQSFGPHWDDHEVLIVHLLGRKHWDVRAPLALSPHKALHDSHTTGEPLWEGMVDPGTVLQIPRGWGHDVTGRDELTFHLTVTIPRTSVLDVVGSGLHQLHRDADTYALVGAAMDDAPPDAEVLRDLVGRGARRDRMGETRATAAANIRSRHVQPLTSLLDALEGRTADDDLWVRSPHPGGVMVADGGDTDHTLAFGQRTVRITSAGLELMGPCLDGRPHRVAELDGDLGGSTPRVIVDDALRTGLLGVARPPGSDPVLDP